MPETVSSRRIVEFEQSPLEDRLREAIEYVDLTDLIRQNSDTNLPLSEKRVDDYSLMHLQVPERAFFRGNGWAEDFYNPKGYIFPKQYIDEKFYKIWLNSPDAVALCYKGSPNALISYKDLFGCVLQISQIQGIQAYKNEQSLERLHSRGLACLDWTKLMVEICEYIANMTGVKEVKIVSAGCVANSDQNQNYPIERAQNIYDKTAMRMGYEYYEQGFWSKSL